MKNGAPSCDHSVNGTHVRRRGLQNHCRDAAEHASADQLVLARGLLRVEIAAAAVLVHGSPRTAAGCCAPPALWVADGTVHDQFIQFTEGVVAREQRAPARARAARARDRGATQSSVDAVGRPRTAAARRASVWRCRDGDQIAARARGRRRAAAAGARLGPRARVSTLSGWACATAPRFDQAGRDVQLGADRRYTGPDCPPEMLAEGGIPQGDCAPAPWLLSSRGYGVWCQTDGNGTRFDSAGDRVERLDARTRPGRCGCACCARRRRPRACAHFCRLTGFPALLPEWGYGFWKSRDVHEHQDDVIDDYDGLSPPPDRARRDRDRLTVGDAIQHLGVQPAPVPGRARG